MSYEAELPKIEDTTEDWETFAAGFTPTKSGNWVTELLVKPLPIVETEVR